MTGHKSNTISGPILGVSVSEQLIQQLLQQQNPTKVMQLTKANEHTGFILCFFSNRDVNMKKRSINGTYFNEKKGVWERKEFGYPNIIYRRNILPKRFEKELLEQKVKPLNYLHGFNKWNVYEQLSKDKDYFQYLPLTFLYNKPNDLSKMFEISNKVYLKALRGGRGKQVIRAIKLSGGAYEYSYFNNRLFRYKVNSFNDLIKGIVSFFGKRRFLIQQGIDLMTIDDKIVDLRAEVQKNGKGEIIVTAISVRVSQKNAPITTHADIYAFDNFFKDIMHYSEMEIIVLKKRINSFLNITYKAIEKIYGPSGEIGIDIGLDKKGKLWFIECNSRSLKVSFFKAYDQETINQSYQNLLEYGKNIYTNEI